MWDEPEAERLTCTTHELLDISIQQQEPGTDPRAGRATPEIATEIATGMSHESVRSAAMASSGAP